MSDNDLVTSGGQVVEFNSNLAVLIRIDKIINAIISVRYGLMQRGNDGLPLAQIEQLVSHIITLYKEICVEFTKEELEIWDKIKELRNRIESNPPRPSEGSIAYWRKTIHEIDEIEISLRMMAKKHGFLSSNKRDASKAALRR